MFSKNDDISDIDLNNFEVSKFTDLQLLSTPQNVPYWNPTPMVQWTSSEVIDFIKAEITSKFDGTWINLEGFESISGFIFGSLKKPYCQTLANSEELGTMIFEAKENYIRLNPFNEGDFQSAGNTNMDENVPKIENCGIIKDKPTKLGKPKTGSKKTKRVKSVKLWEFLIYLLRDESTCPRIIKWENYAEGTFRFVKGDIVASLWGSRNNNKTMDYGKLTRAMRYHYRNKILLPVPGRRHVYKFGPRAAEFRSL